MKIGVMFGSPETTTGGNALKMSTQNGPPRHAPHRRHQGRATLDKKEPGVSQRHPGQGRQGNNGSGSLAFPRGRVRHSLRPGISRAADVLDLASEVGVIEKSGAWFSFQGERIGQGRDNARTYSSSILRCSTRPKRLLLAKACVFNEWLRRGPRRRRKKNAAPTNNIGCAPGAMRQGPRHAATFRGNCQLERALKI